MAFSIDIDKNNRIISYVPKGIIGIYDLKDAWEELFSIDEFCSLKYNLLSDYRNVKFNLEVKQFNYIVSYLKAHKDILSNKKQAVITTDPIITAKSFIYREEVIKKIEFNIQVFSTIESAMNWLVD